MLCWQHLMVTAQRLTVIIEEKLLLKLLSFFGYGQTGAGRLQAHCLAGTCATVVLCVTGVETATHAELETLDENLHEKSSKDAGAPKRYYFENLKISLPQFKLSVFTSHKLPPDLKVPTSPSQLSRPIHRVSGRGRGSLKCTSFAATAS